MVAQPKQTDEMLQLLCVCHDERDAELDDGCGPMQCSESDKLYNESNNGDERSGSCEGAGSRTSSASNGLRQS